MDNEWISVPVDARLLGLQVRTVHNLIRRGALPAEVTMSALRPRPQRRASRLRRQDVLGFLVRSRVKPGELRALHASMAGHKER